MSGRPLPPQSKAWLHSLSAGGKGVGGPPPCTLFGLLQLPGRPRSEPGCQGRSRGRGLAGATSRCSRFQGNLAAERSEAQKAQGPNSTPEAAGPSVCRTWRRRRVFCSVTYVCWCKRVGEGCGMGVEFHFKL